MAHSEARAWWADVQHLRDGYERTDEARRRADEADLAARRAIRERRGVEAEVNSLLSAPRRSPAVTPRRVSGPEVSSRRGHHAELVHAAADGAQPEGLAGFAGHAGSAGGAGAGFAGQAGFAGPAAADTLPAEAPASHRPRVKGSPTPGRRMVEIRGRTVPAPFVPRPAEPDRRRPSRRPFERMGGRPDRVAMWALLMGLLLILVAIGTADSPAVVSLFLR